MKIPDIIEKIEHNQKLISEYGIFDNALLNRINYKLRLDWNYYSNRIEGGTLTKAETRSVMVGNIDIQGKPLKDVMEMNGHNKVVLEVLKMSKGDIRISEKRIKDIHKAIMQEDNPELLKEVGNWKSEPNEIINYKGEKILFTMPDEVQEKVHTLLNTTNAELDKYFKINKGLHPLQIAAQFHIDFIGIHPFYDGNGRTTRILTNILLMACGYPAIIVKDSHKKQYYQILADIQVYGGNNDLFYEFIGERILESQDLILKAINGEDIDDEDDLDKKIKLLETELSNLDSDNDVKEKFSQKVFFNIYDTWFTQLFSELLPIIMKFNPFFNGSNHSIDIPYGFGYKNFVSGDSEIILNEFKKDSKANLDTNFRTDNFYLSVNTFYGNFIKGGINTFGCNYGVYIRILKDISYKVSIDEFNDDGNKQVVMYEKLLHQPLTKEEIKKINFS